MRVHYLKRKGIFTIVLALVLVQNIYSNTMADSPLFSLQRQEEGDSVATTI
jgi:hypothetical protein